MTRKGIVSRFHVYNDGSKPLVSTRLMMMERKEKIKEPKFLGWGGRVNLEKQLLLARTLLPDTLGAKEP